MHKIYKLYIIYRKCGTKPIIYTVSEVPRKSIVEIVHRYLYVANKRLNERTETRTRVCAWVGIILEIMYEKRNYMRKSSRFADDSFVEHFVDQKGDIIK